MHAFLLCFIPLFVAVDAIGVLPLYMGFTRGITPQKNRTLVVQSALAALIAGMLFLVLGKWILQMLGITIDDFMIAGGIILFLIASSDLLTFEKPHRRIENTEIGPVPIGVPLIVGPGVLTTGMLLIDQFGMALTSIALACNILIAGIVLWFAPYIARMLGKNGAKIISKLAGLLLAAFGVMMVRRGIMHFF
jgi:multiple antibiotic resistance protein